MQDHIVFINQSRVCVADSMSTLNIKLSKISLLHLAGWHATPDLGFNDLYPTKNGMNLTDIDCGHFTK